MKVEAHGGLVYSIERASGDDVDPWLACVGEQVRDNGDDGVYFSPRPRDYPGPSRSSDAIAEWASRIGRPLTEGGWFRLWLVRDPSDQIVGHVDLSGGRLQAELHRAELGIGLITGHRGLGLGPALLEAAIRWARDAGVLDYIELGVFAQNPRARRLYEHFGFVQIGVIPDRFRLDGVVIDDVRMTLRLR